jgi:hypothetical protein
MDLFAIPKEWLVASAKFLRGQFLVGIQILRNPLDIISALDLNVIDTLFPALKFVLFVYILTIPLNLIKFYLIYKISLYSPINLLLDFIATMVTFIAFILLWHLLARLVKGRGEFLKSFITGSYMTLFLLSTYLPDVAVFANATARLVISGPEQPQKNSLLINDVIFYYVIILVLLIIIISVIRKIAPVVVYIHSVGKLRAIFVSTFSLLGYAYVSIAWMRWMIIELMKQKGGL